MGSQWRGALRTRHAIADLMKSRWYWNVTVMVLVSARLFIIRYSFPSPLRVLIWAALNAFRGRKMKRTFVLVNTWGPFFQNSCPCFSSWHDLFAFWQRGMKTVKLGFQFISLSLFFSLSSGAVLLLIFWNLAEPSERWVRGASGAHCLCKRVNGWRPLDLMEMNWELWEWPCKCTSTTFVSGGPFPVARWIMTMFLPRVRVLMWGAFGPPQVLFTAMIYSLKEQTGPDKTIWFEHLITS